MNYLCEFCIRCACLPIMPCDVTCHDRLIYIQITSKQISKMVVVTQVR